MSPEEILYDTPSHAELVEQIAQTEVLSAEEHAEREYDFGGYEHYSTGLLARILYSEGLLGIGWDEAEPDTSDERYRRCCLAAGAALDTYWDEATSLQSGEPCGPPATPIHEVFRLVDAFVFSKITRYYEALREGISSPEYRRQCRRSRAAARRAIASLFGEAAMREAESRFDQMQEEQTANPADEREAS